MQAQSKLLNQLKILESLYHSGSLNATIEQTLDKIIYQELATAQQKQLELETDLQTFERQYDMTSAEFQQRFQAGQLGDDVDFVEWNAFYEIWNTLNNQICLLQTA
jgi:hypothetical protein